MFKVNNKDTRTHEIILHLVLLFLLLTLSRKIPAGLGLLEPIRNIDSSILLDNDMKITRNLLLNNNLFDSCKNSLILDTTKDCLIKTVRLG